MVKKKTSFQLSQSILHRSSYSLLATLVFQTWQKMMKLIHRGVCVVFDLFFRVTCTAVNLVRMSMLMWIGIILALV